MRGAIHATVGAVVYVWHYRRELTQALALPVLAMLVLVLPGIWLPEGGALSRLGLAAAGAIPQALMAITVFRMILLGPVRVDRWGMDGFFELRGLKLILYAILFGLVLGAVFLGRLWLPAGTTPVLVMVAVYLAARLALVFPAIAVDEPASFLRAWQDSHSHQIMMLAVVAVFPLMGMVLVYVLAWLPLDGLWIAPPLVFVVNLLVDILQWASIALAYLYIQRQGR